MKRAPRIESETPIQPRAVAEAVWEEASVWLDEPLPRRWLRELIAHANTVYAHNERFRQKLRGHGHTGRDYLWIFTRHWLAALIQKRRPQLHARLPQSFNAGEALPLKPTRRRPTEAREHPSFRSSHPKPVMEEAWAAAAHCYF